MKELEENKALNKYLELRNKEIELIHALEKLDRKLVWRLVQTTREKNAALGAYLRIQQKEE